MIRLRELFKYRPFKSKKILLIDDEVDWGWILQKIIREAGHKVVFAPTFKEGVEKFKRLKNLDIVIVDLRLDDKNGLTFVKKARSLNKKVKLIMLTAFGNSDVKEKARKLGVDRFLDKPLKAERLLDIINHY